MPKPNQSSLSEHLETEVLSSAIQAALQETIFSSGLRISPRRTGEISRSLEQSFFAYYDERDLEVVYADGIRLAGEGLGPKSLLAAAEALRRVCAEKSNPLEDLPEIASTYVTTLTLGYIEGREHRLLEQQGNTYRAFIRAQGQDKGSQ